MRVQVDRVLLNRMYQTQFQDAPPIKIAMMEMHAPWVIASRAPARIRISQMEPYVGQGPLAREASAKRQPLRPARGVPRILIAMMEQNVLLIGVKKESVLIQICLIVQDVQEEGNVRVVAV